MPFIFASEWTSSHLTLTSPINTLTAVENVLFVIVRGHDFSGQLIFRKRDFHGFASYQAEFLYGKVQLRKEFQIRTTPSLAPGLPRMLMANDK